MAAIGKWRWISGAAAALLLVPGAARPEDDLAGRAADQLHRRGLVKITGRVWGLPLEQELRERLRGLSAVRERIVTAQRELDELAARNEVAWKAASAAMAAIDQELAQLPAGDPQRSVLLRQRSKWKAAAIPPAELAGRDVARGTLARLAQDRCTLAIDLISIRSAADSLGEHYRELAGDDSLKQLFEAAGKKCRLGPARNYQVEIGKLDDYERLAFASQVPFYLQSGRVRVSAVIGDAACVTFSWNEASDAVSYLPASMARAAGVEVPADAQEETLRIGGRTIAAREVFLPSLRLGSIHAKSVAAFILPPAAEDLGAQLTPLALSPWRVKIEREKMKLTLSNDQQPFQDR